MPNPMKEIDWNLVTSNVVMEETFAVKLRNRFNELSEPSDDIETIYNKLKQSTEEIALAFPEKKKQPLNASIEECS